MQQIILFIALPVVGIVLGWTIRWLYARFQLSASEQKAERVKQDAIREAEAQKKEILLQAKEQLIQDRNQQERENRERRRELQSYESRVTKKEEQLDQRSAELDKRDKEFGFRVAEMQKRENAMSEKEQILRTELERISGLTKEEAKSLIIKNLENDARPIARYYLERIIKNYPDLLVQGQSVHFLCLQNLIRISETSGNRITYYNHF